MKQKKADGGNPTICLIFGTPVEHFNIKKNDAKSRSAGAGFESRFQRDYASAACRLGPNPAERNKKSRWRLIHHLQFFLVRPAGFEPAAYGFEVGFRAKTTGKDRQEKVN
jgi:hypothetical protein